MKEDEEKNKEKNNIEATKTKQEKKTSTKGTAKKETKTKTKTTANKAKTKTTTKTEPKATSKPKTENKTTATTKKNSVAKTNKEKPNQPIKEEKKEQEIEEEVKIPKTEEVEKTIMEPEKLSKEEQPKENEEKTKKEEKVEFENSKFDGGLLQLIGWKILGFIVTLFTLGIGYPFALCFVYRWQMKHTKINGKQLVFDGKGYQLLGKWILWMLLSIITLGIYTLWIPVQKNKWIIKHTHYKDTQVQEENNQSQFTGSTLQYIGWLLLGTILTICSFGLLYPCALCLMYNWRIKNTVIDGDNMEFDGKSMQLWGLWIKWILLSIITLGIYSLWIPISLLKWETKHTNKKGLSAKPYSIVKAIILPIIIVIAIVVLQVVGISFYMSTLNNKLIIKQPRLKESEITHNEHDYYDTKTDKLDYTKLNEFSDGVAWAQGKDDNFYLIDKTGKSIFKLRKINRNNNYI